MSDILIRNVPDSLKLQLTDAAERAGRSVSAEAIEILTTSLGAEPEAAPELQEKPVSAGERMRAILGTERFTEEELAEIAAIRHAPDREPPRFD